MSDDLNRRLASLYSRGVVRQNDVAAGLASPQAEYFKGELHRTEMPQLFGFASQQLPGSVIFSIFANGERSAPVALAGDDRRYRPRNMKPGDVMVYGLQTLEAFGHSIAFVDTPKPGTIKIRASRIELRAGNRYRLIDSDPAIGERAGLFPADEELPLAP